MRKITLILYFFFCLYCLSESCAHTKNKEIHKKTKENHNQVYFSGDAYLVRFKMTHYCITPGQPFDSSNDVASFSGEKSLDIMAGRHGSKATVDCIRASHTDPDFFIKHFTYKKSPKKLNFSIEGTLTVNGVQFDDVILAEGHHLLNNNWWFGGSHCSVATTDLKRGANAINCLSRTGKNWCFIRGKTSGKVGLKHQSYTSYDKIKVTEHLCKH
ncbi:MAG: hypothetical protein OXC48_10990 [Endozoicomonadaceae bacterium]|nr:hypothetical protein [Endozoicomonadaceae bacterium]